MKTLRNIAIWTLIGGMAIGTAIVTVDAFGGQGNGQWNWAGQWQGQGKHLSQGMRQGQGRWQQLHSGQWQNVGSGRNAHQWNGSPATLIANIPLSALSESEKTALAFQYQEERVAYDLYTHFASLYGTRAFDNIRASEAEHMLAVKALLDRYSLPVPEGYGTLGSTYESLKKLGETSEKDALEVGLKVEMLDIEDMEKAIKATDNDDIRIVFTNIGGASYNHLRGFSKALSQKGYATSTDISEYLTKDEALSGGSLKHKLAERLEKDGVSLPELASSTGIAANCAAEDAKMASKQRTMDQIDAKYGKRLRSADEAAIKRLRDKTDSVISNIEKSEMNEQQKERKLGLYETFKEYLASLFD